MSSTSLKQCVESASPCQGINHPDYRLFLSTNEQDVPETLRKLRQQKVMGNLMVGVSATMILNMASIRGVEAEEGEYTLRGILVVDRSVRAQAFWKMLEKFILSSSTPKEAIQSIKDHVWAERDFYFKGIEQYSVKDEAKLRLENFDKEIEAGQSWLSDERRFEKIQLIFKNHCFAFCLHDLRDSKNAATLASSLKENGWEIDTFYSSNVYEYMKDARDKQLFQQGIVPFIAPKTLIVDTRLRKCENCEPLKQRIRRLNSSPHNVLFAEKITEHKCKDSSVRVTVISGAQVQHLSLDKGQSLTSLLDKLLSPYSSSQLKPV